MILRPVSPQSPCGPPVRKQPVGLMWHAMSFAAAPASRRGFATTVALDEVLALATQDRQQKLLDDRLSRIVREVIDLLAANHDVARVLRAQDDGVDTVRGAVGVVFHRHLALGVRPRPVTCRPRLGVVLDEAVRVDRRQRGDHRSQCTRNRTSSPGLPRADVDALTDVRALGVDAAIDLAGVGRESNFLASAWLLAT